MGDLHACVYAGIVRVKCACVCLGVW